MPYHQIEELRSRKNEKIAMFLTAENAIGLILAGFPAYASTAELPLVLRIPIVGVAAVLGVAITLDVGGLAFYERVLWRIRGALRQRISGARITPEQLAGAATSSRIDRPLRAGGPIRIVREHPASVHPARRSPTRAVAPVGAPVSAAHWEPAYADRPAE
jgi:hypothetical protein